MSGATLQCGTFEGNDKSASPIACVMGKAFEQAFGRKPRGRLIRKFAAFVGHTATGAEAHAEEAILQVKFSEESEILPTVAQRLLPYFEEYQAQLLEQLGITDDLEQIWNHVSPSPGEKYGDIQDPGWHLYCLHDLIPACRMSVKEQIPVRVCW